MIGNFPFIKGQWDVYEKLGESAERNVYQDPHTSIMKLRLFGETIVKFVLAANNIREANRTIQVNHISTPAEKTYCRTSKCTFSK